MINTKGSFPNCRRLAQWGFLLMLILAVPFLSLSGCGPAEGPSDQSFAEPTDTAALSDTTGSTAVPTAPVAGSSARTTVPSRSTSVGAPETTRPAVTAAATTRARVPLTYAEAVRESGLIGGVRDPFVLLHDGVYYMYTTWWQLYISDRLDGGWLGPYTCVTPPDGYDGDPWAPEVYAYGGAFYMVWCGEHTGTPDHVGRMLCAPMSRDLTRLTAAPTQLFRADDAPWATNTVTDGCFLYRCADGTLLMLWSNRENGGYCVGVAVSESGKVTGPWRQENDRLYTRSLTGRYDGGPGMIFRDKAGALWMAIHSPNSASAGRQEMPVFIPLIEEGGRLRWDLLSR